MHRAIVIKAYIVDKPDKWANTKDEDLVLVSHQEIEFESNTDRHIHSVFKNLARWLCEKRKGVV